MVSDDDLNALLTSLDKAVKAAKAADDGVTPYVRKSRRGAFVAARKHLANARNELDMAVKALGK